MNGIRFKEDRCGATLHEIEIKPGAEHNNVSNSSKIRQQRVTSLLKEIFLPQGYPDSVSTDYMEYQIWDTLQELCSSLNGTLASHAIFKGMGVGNSGASALGVTYTWLLKDGSGMLSNIMFAWSKGTLLDIDAKRWRLFADVLNDVAMLVDLLSPLAPPYLFTVTMCCTSVFRSLVGVAGGCTRATIKQHQALCNNTADVSAKDGSQANMSNLLGLLMSMTLINLVSTSHTLTWATFTLLTALHLYFNYRACSCLVMKSLNPTRYTLLLNHWFEKEIILDPYQVNKIEPFIFGAGCGSNRIVLGASLKNIRIGSESDLEDISKRNYIIYNYKGKIVVCLKSGSTHLDQLQAYYFAYSSLLGGSADTNLFTASITATDLRGYDIFVSKLSSHGWDLSFAPLGANEIRFTAVN